MNTMNYSKAKKLISDADAILIGAGAGLSSSAGIDYSKESFRKYFPELVEAYKMTDMYTSSFYEFKTEEERWSYWAKHIHYSFIAPPPLKAYQELFDLIKDKEYFVITTNVDGQFLKSSFAQDRLFEVQGSYGQMQCMVGCHDKVYDDTALVLKMLQSKDKLRVDAKLVPKCPVCGGKMDIHIRKNAFFVEDEAWKEAYQRYEKFLRRFKGKRLVLIELGVGYNTPGIIRFPFEQLTYEGKSVSMIRINDKSTATVLPIEKKTILLKEDCAKAIHQLLET